MNIFTNFDGRLHNKIRNADIKLKLKIETEKHEIVCDHKMIQKTATISQTNTNYTKRSNRNAMRNAKTCLVLRYCVCTRPNHFINGISTAQPKFNTRHARRRAISIDCVVAVAVAIEAEASTSAGWRKGAHYLLMWNSRARSIIVSHGRRSVLRYARVRLCAIHRADKITLTTLGQLFKSSIAQSSATLKTEWLI